MRFIGISWGRKLRLVEESSAMANPPCYLISRATATIVLTSCGRPMGIARHASRNTSAATGGCSCNWLVSLPRVVMGRIRSILAE